MRKKQQTVKTFTTQLLLRFQDTTRNERIEIAWQEFDQSRRYAQFQQYITLFVYEANFCEAEAKAREAEDEAEARHKAMKFGRL